MKNNLKQGYQVLVSLGNISKSNALRHRLGSQESTKFSFHNLKFECCWVIIVQPVNGVLCFKIYPTRVTHDMRQTSHRVGFEVGDRLLFLTEATDFLFHLFSSDQRIAETLYGQM
ncbi:hypothetical protein PQC55_gp063 [Escherichia phage vB_EcoP-CHD5UKE1]|uniref:Uncharacterized protein n=1 Tax=Escherichia phage vB_EcoP-CHD5UKE1 TaxID=2865805 RepID=A0ABX9AI25_9CAUD|nr:hypothetical protein PQC55_gp063 [Escherichia phage vB_EcoP-CHD5UKE1]QZI80559.1 hypothetical protein CHD5UKE1_0063 [Escherichia phage vB_EcoP-CHD5UKE1]